MGAEKESQMDLKKLVINSEEKNLEKMEVGLNPESIFSKTAHPRSPNSPDVPDPEVPEKAIRRKYPGEYKLKILEEAESCNQSGELGALLRREGLYSSNLTTWRRQKEQGMLEALSPKKRGRKAISKTPLALKVIQLERENQKLRQKLHQAETIIEVQKKISEILQIPITKDEEKSS
jgi:transposase